MVKIRVLVIAMVVLIAGSLGLIDRVMATHASSHKAFSGGSTFKGLVVKTTPFIGDVTALDPSWQTMDSRGFQIPAGDSQLVVADFFSESFCRASTVGSCRVRILIGRTLESALVAEPTSSAPIFDAATTDAGGSHAISRALCVRNATSSPLDISVWVQATRSGSHISWSLAGSTFKIARNSTCTPSVNI